MPENTWEQLQVHILAELERLDKWCNDLNQDCTAGKIEIAKLKVQALMIAGGVSLVISSLLWLAKAVTGI